MFNKKIKLELNQIKEDYLNLKREFDVFRFKSLHPKGYNIKIVKQKLPKTIVNMLLSSIYIEYVYDNPYSNTSELKISKLSNLQDIYIDNCDIEVVKETEYGFIIVYRYIDYLNRVCLEAYEVEKRTSIVLDITDCMSEYPYLSVYLN